MNHHPKRVPLLGVAALLGAATQAQAGGFALIEHGASGMGNAYAGAAAVSVDGSTVWFNPAGMTELPNREFTVGGHIIASSTDYTDQGSTLNTDVGGAPILRDGESGSASPGASTFIPNIYYVAPLTDKLSYGLSIGAPFGSSTEYDADWVGRYTTIKSGISVIDINPAIAYRVSDKVRLGGGISLQRLSAELGTGIDSSVSCNGIFAADIGPCVTAGLSDFGNVNLDSSAVIEGDSTAVSFNVGALFLPTPDTRIGVAYRHSVDHELDGDADFTTNAILAGLLASNPATSGLFVDQGATAQVDLPASFSVSVAHRLPNRLELLGDITWTGWSSFEELLIEFEGDQPDTVSLQEWDDVLRLSAGVNYTVNDKLTLRGGVAFDEEAIPSPQRRTARIPGNDRTWVSGGLGYQINKNASFDVGVAFLSLDETPIDNSNSESAGAPTIRGVYDSSVFIGSAQFNWTFN